MGARAAGDEKIISVPADAIMNGRIPPADRTRASLVRFARSFGVGTLRADPHRRAARDLIKARDADARRGPDIMTERPASVRRGRTWQEGRRTGNAGGQALR